MVIMAYPFLFATSSLTSQGWKLFFLTSWGRFERRFDHILEDLKDHGDLVDKEATAYNIAEAREARQDLEARKLEKLSRLDRNEQSRTARELGELITWLRVDLADQISILDKVIDESSRHPGTCSWALNNTLMKSWLSSSREVTNLWLHGNPGSGKSVITGYIVDHLKASKHPLVITHYCTYLYASSIQYERILQSITLQLTQESDNLIAHIHQNYVVGKKIMNLRMCELLLLEAATAVFGLPGQSRSVHIILDGIDELEPEYQGKLVGLLSKMTNLARGHGAACKVLISCRTTPVLEKVLSKKHVLSLSDQRERLSLEDGIRLYSKQRLNAIDHRLSQLRINEDMIDDISQRIANKADGIHSRQQVPTERIKLTLVGMFLWARLVLDYLSTNLFHTSEEFIEAINMLPRRLSDL